jgi:antitoxin component of RelBE/YafQ-DinJ toxin-antitoxin module
MSKIVVRIGDDQRQALRDRADEIGLSVSDLIRIGIARLLTDPDVKLPRVTRERAAA